MSLRFRIIFSCACAVLAALACYAYGEQVRQEASQASADALARYGGEVVRLVVAEETLEAGDVITQANAAERDWASTLAPEGAITSFDEVVGKQVSVATAKGMPLCELAFREDDEAIEVPEGLVALTLPVTERLGIPRTIAQGTRVEAYRVDDEGSVPIASDMLVLSSQGSSTAGSAQAQVVIAARPDDVADVLSASSTGDLRLVLPAEGVSSSAGEGSSAPEEVAGTDLDGEAADQAAAASTQG